MTVTYLTGTRNPGAALLRFLPDYIEMLLERGETLITTNKRGVDEAVIRHCEQHKLPLQVCEFLADQRRNANRRVKGSLKHVEVLRIYSPTWLRFRHMAQQVEKMVFLHAHKTAGRCYGLSTTNAVKLACEKYQLQAEQLIVQQQHKAWIAVTELRQAPTVGAAHIYIYARQAPGLDGTRHCTAHFRIESWRQIGEVIQPGIGRREFILPNISRDEANLTMLHQALLELQKTQPQRLVIHHTTKALPSILLNEAPCIQAEITALLKPYQQIIWQKEPQPDLLVQIGAPISKGQQLWNHTKLAATYRGLYQ
ncbi:MAG: hypothetical protein K8I82_28990 [Anaerolineae bacterium]|nr:hypothetical protein [Anaerolineae bacterium]